MLHQERKALQSILQCRTPVMGGRSYRCSHCEKDHFAWHSCNHRICPRCGAGDAQQWIAGKLDSLLPVPYYMATFTLPSQLRTLCRCQAELFLKLFFASSAQAIKDVLKQSRHLGGDCGVIGFLQSWTQDLRLHPHIHYIIPGIGIDESKKITRPRNPEWLAYGSVFASRLKTHLLKALEKEGLLSKAETKPLWAIGWNCDVKNFGNGANAIKYLGSYVRRGPLSDSRILKIQGDMITISVRNRDSGVIEQARIQGVEFVRRYLQHALPSGFHAVRYYGFLHPRSKNKLAVIGEQLGARIAAESNRPEPQEPPAPTLCPRCRKPMEMTAQLSRAPPWERSIPRIWARRQKAAA